MQRGTPLFSIGGLIVLGFILFFLLFDSLEYLNRQPHVVTLHKHTHTIYSRGCHDEKKIAMKNALNNTSNGSGFVPWG